MKSLHLRGIREQEPSTLKQGKKTGNFELDSVDKINEKIFLSDQVLGAVLLLGVMGIYASCVVYVLPPTSITCAVREWAPPLCLALCYGILLVKSMHLRALVSVGVGGEVSSEMCLIVVWIESVLRKENVHSYFPIFMVLQIKL